jgi:hypothetical protein
LLGDWLLGDCAPGCSVIGGVLGFCATAQLTAISKIMVTKNVFLIWKASKTELTVAQLQIVG